VLLLLPHANPVAKLSLPQGPLQRDDFDVRQFVEEHALRTDGGGAFMWRAVWDEESSRIWREVISEDPSHLIGEVHVGLIYYAEKQEPRYGYPPKPDPYAALKSVKKYA
jgi:large subunit ribosomal protein L35